MKANERTQFGRAIAAERRTANMTQEQLGTLAGLSAPGINRCENKLRRVEIATLRALCTCWPDQATNVSVLIAHLHDEIRRAGHESDDYEIEHRTSPATYRGASRQLSEIAHARPDIAAHLYGLIDKLWVRFQSETTAQPAIAADPAAQTIAPQVKHAQTVYTSPRKSSVRQTLKRTKPA